jgi:hypothetical protein
VKPLLGYLFYIIAVTVFGLPPAIGEKWEWSVLNNRQNYACGSLSLTIFLD